MCFHQTRRTQQPSWRAEEIQVHCTANAGSGTLNPGTRMVGGMAFKSRQAALRVKLAMSLVQEMLSRMHFLCYCIHLVWPHVGVTVWPTKLTLWCVR